MHMRMVMVVCCRHFAGAIGVGRWGVVLMLVSVLMAVVAEMGRIALLRMLQRVAYADHRRIGGVQREQDGKQEGEAGAHGGGL